MLPDRPRLRWRPVSVVVRPSDPPTSGSFPRTHKATLEVSASASLLPFANNTVQIRFSSTSTALRLDNPLDLTIDPPLVPGACHLNSRLTPTTPLRLLAAS